MKKRDTIKRCFIYIEVGHLAKNCMNIGRIEDGKKEKADNIIKKMRQQWIKKSPKNTSLIIANIDTQVNEQGGTITST